MSYADRIKINKYDLDEEAIRLPSDYYDAAKAEVDATDVRDHAKNYLEFIENRALLKIRSMNVKKINEEYGLQITSVTEATLKALISQDPEVHKCREDLIRHKKQLADAKAIRQAFEKKYGMIEILSYLQRTTQYLKDHHNGVPKHPIGTKALQSKADDIYG